jgi:hypothetical protein
LSGETDLRGVYVAEGVKGQATAVARQDTARYAFYRGQTPLGAVQPAVPMPAAAPGAPNGGSNAAQSLEENLRVLNSANQMRNFDRLQQRYQAPAPSAPSGAAAGGFR